MYAVLLSTAGPSRWPVPTPLHGERLRARGSLAKSPGGSEGKEGAWQRLCCAEGSLVAAGEAGARLCAALL